MCAYVRLSVCVPAGSCVLCVCTHTCVCLVFTHIHVCECVYVHCVRVSVYCTHVCTQAVCMCVSVTECVLCIIQLFVSLCHMYSSTIVGVIFTILSISFLH